MKNNLRAGEGTIEFVAKIVSDETQQFSYFQMKKNQTFIHPMLALRKEQFLNSM